MKIFKIILLFVLIIPIIKLFYDFIRNELSKTWRMKFYDLHTKFIKECTTIQNKEEQLKALEWLYQKFKERSSNLTNSKITEQFEKDFYEIWGHSIPEYKSQTRNNKLKDLGI
jgi:hypothetical protein